VGARSPQLERLLQRIGASGSVAAAEEQRAAVPAAGAPAGTPSAPAGTPSAHTGLGLPAPRVSALLVLVFLGFGIILGHAASSRVNATLASSRGPLKVLLPASGDTASAAAPTTTTESSSSAGEPSSAAAEATPTPAPATKTNTPAAKTPSSSSSPASGGSSSGSGSGASGSEGEASAGKGGAAEATPATKLPAVKHVFVIMLSDEPYASVFGPTSTAPYLAHTLEGKGELLARYDAVAHEELANEVALISGQGPTAETAANCPNYTEIAPAGSGPDEQVLGSGCVYPQATQTLASQLAAKHLSWRAYVQGIDEAGTQAGACAHPTLGQADPTAVQTSSTGAYATFTNPFVYFASITSSPTCATDDLGLASLKSDLGSANSTPSVAYIVPDRCNDGNPTPCTPGAPAGMAPANTFLQKVVPEITGSKAYKESGLLVITVDEAPSTGEFADSSSCCGQPLFPNAPSKTPAGAPRGGGTVGALLLSPFVKAGTTSQEEFNHFSLLRTIEDLFGLGHLGYAGLPTVKSFEPSMFIVPAKG
jgi:phosphatidylinositol-3-phosphatase